MRKQVADKLVELWNLTHPVGTSVAVVDDRGEVVTTSTRTPAFACLGPALPEYDNQEPVILVDHVAGALELARVLPLRNQQLTFPDGAEVRVKVIMGARDATHRVTAAELNEAYAGPGEVLAFCARCCLSKLQDEPKETDPCGQPRIVR